MTHGEQVKHPRRILHVVYSFGIGGSESVAREVAMTLQGRGYENMVLALEHDGPLSQEFRDNGIATKVVDRAHCSMTHAMRSISETCRDFRPDVIHTHHMYMLFHAVPSALRHRIPIVHTEHEFWSLNTRKGKLLMPFLGRACGKITAVNEDTCRFMADVLKLQKKKLVTVLNGIDLCRFNGETPLSREELGLAATDKVAVIVARLEPVKNHAMLLRAWTQVVRDVPEAKLLIVGEGSSQDALERQRDALGLTGKVLMLGPRRDVHDVLPLADAGVLSSRDEGLPMCLLEAMASRLPVVATDVGGVNKLVREGVNGRLVGDDDDAAFARALAAVFGDSEAAGRMGETGRSLVKGTYDLETSVDQYCSLYSELVAARR